MEDNSLKAKTAKGLFWGGLSNGIQQLLSIVFGIFLARKLTNSDYGLVGMVTIFSILANIIQDSGFKIALINKRDISHEDYNSVFWFNITMSAFLYIILFLCAPFIAEFYNEPILVPLSRVVFLAILCSAFGAVQGAYIQRNLMVKEMSITAMFSILISGIVGVTMAFLGFAYWAIAIQNIIYCLTMTILVWHFSSWKPTFSFSTKPIKQMFVFSSKLLITNFVGQLNNNIFNVVLGRFYAKNQVGDYTQSNKWTGFGVNFINGMMSGVSQPVFAKIEDDNERKCRIFRKMLRFVSFVSFPAMFGLAFISEFIPLVLGEQWTNSSELLEILCVGGAFIPITALYSNMLVSQGKSDVIMWNTICICLCQIIFALLAYPYGLKYMLYLYVAVNVFWFFIWHMQLHRIIKIKLLDVLKDIVPFAVVAICIIALTGVIVSFIEHPWIKIISKIVIVAFLYILLMRELKVVVFNDCVMFLKQKIHG